MNAKIQATTSNCRITNENRMNHAAKYGYGTNMQAHTEKICHAPSSVSNLRGVLNMGTVNDSPKEQENKIAAPRDQSESGDKSVTEDTCVDPCEDQGEYTSRDLRRQVFATSMSTSEKIVLLLLIDLGSNEEAIRVQAADLSSATDLHRKTIGTILDRHHSNGWINKRSDGRGFIIRYLGQPKKDPEATSDVT